MDQARAPRVFLQTSGVTCGIACTMMIMNYHFGTPMSRTWEEDLRKSLRAKKYNLVPAIRLASLMCEEGLDVSVRHQDSHKFWSRMRAFDTDLYSEQESAYAEARLTGVRFDSGVISGAEIKSELDNRRLLIYGIFLCGDVKHALLIYGYTDNVFFVIDPLVGRSSYTIDELIRVGNLDTGRWYITVGALPLLPVAKPSGSVP